MISEFYFFFSASSPGPYARIPQVIFLVRLLCLVVFAPRGPFVSSATVLYLLADVGAAPQSCMEAFQSVPINIRHILGPLINLPYSMLSAAFGIQKLCSSS